LQFAVNVRDLDVMVMAKAGKESGKKRMNHEMALAGINMQSPNITTPAIVRWTDSGSGIPFRFTASELPAPKAR
jgi:hypothetical protein